MKKGVIIQARIGSSRLPGKVLLDLKGKSVLEHVVERVSLSKKIDEIIIATTTSKIDDKLYTFAIEKNYNVFRGSETDVLSRYYFCAKHFNLDTIIRITSDCPLIDSEVMDNVIEFYEENNFRIVTNAGNDLNLRTFPRGLDVEVFGINVLEEAYDKATKTYQREHVTPYIYESSNEVGVFKSDVNYSQYRWTLDTNEDFLLLSNIYEKFYKGKHDFYLNDIIEYLDENPELILLNKHVEQKKLDKED